MLEKILPPAQEIKILAVDDSELDIQNIEMILQPEGYQIIAAISGEEALRKISEQAPHIVLSDVKMPGMDGFELCRRIKRHPSSVFLPVVLVTGHKGDSDKVAGIEAGADDFLPKPPSREELLARVKSLVTTKILHDRLESSNQKLRDLVDQRTEELQRATSELQRLLEEKASFSADLTPASHPRPTRERPGPQSPLAEQGEPGEEQDFKQRLMAQLESSLHGRADLSKAPEIVRALSRQLAEIYHASGVQLEEERRDRIFREIVDELVGYGPIEPLLADPEISEIMINGPESVFVEKHGRITKSDCRFRDDEHVQRMIERIIRPLGRRIDRNSPAVDARLPDGSRVNAIIPPCAIDGPSVTIRKFTSDKLSIEDLIELGSLNSSVAEFLGACVKARLNMIVSGGTGSGKTTLLNVLSACIPPEERIVTIEDSAELQLKQEHVVRLEYKPPERDGTGEMSIRDLVRNSLRMRPDRIVIGEVRGGETLDMLQAMNTGHDGSLTTLHANSPRDSIARLETMALMAGIDLPLTAIRSQIASAVGMIIQVARLRDGTRRVTRISEVQGLEGSIVVLSDVFTFEETSYEKGKIIGQLQPAGFRPECYSRIEALGIQLAPQMFIRQEGCR